jgi:hypothetical protein
MARSRSSSRPIERIVPMGYVAVAIALGALLLPTILRPPQDLQNTSAAFSPDAPPDEPPPEALLQSLRAASSSTAGSKPPVVEEIVVEEEEAQPEAPPARPKPPRAGCFGDPPRQTESLYSALCVPAWTGGPGENGGATTRGVTGEAITIAVGVPTSATVEEAPLGREYQPDDQATERVLKTWQIYFNERFEFYGRFLQFHPIKVDSTDENQARAKVREAAGKGMFAYIGHYATTNAAATNEAIKNGMVTFAFDFNPAEFYKDNHPYAYSFEMDSEQLRIIAQEYLCKQFVGRPLGENNLNERQDLSFDYGGPRKWGLIVYQDELRKGAREKSQAGMQKCGAKYDEVVEYNLNDDSSKIAGAVTKLRQAGVTTIVVGVDPLTPPVLAYEAERTGYFPEWFCAAGCSTNGTGRLLPDNQANHFVTFSAEEIPRVDADKDWYRAYKEIDPEGEPDEDYFRDLQQLSGGIQHAGPKLTPETFLEGLKKQPCRTPDPIWSIGGCYRDPDPRSNTYYLGDYTYSDYASFMWFDNAGKDPNSSSAGAWCYMNMGARYKAGEIPTEIFPFRKPDQCIFTPPRGVQG